MVNNKTDVRNDAVEIIEALTKSMVERPMRVIECKRAHNHSEANKIIYSGNNQMYISLTYILHLLTNKNVYCTFFV